MCPWLWQTMAHPMAIPLLVGVGASSRLPSAAGRERTQLLNKRRFQMTRDSKRPKIGVEQKRDFNMSSIKKWLAYWPARIYKRMFFFIFSMSFQCVSLLRTGCNTNEYNAYISLLTIKYEPVYCAERPWLLPWSWFTWSWDLPWDLYVFGAGGWTCCILPALSQQRVSPVSPNLELILKQPDSQTMPNATPDSSFWTFSVQNFEVGQVHTTWQISKLVTEASQQNVVFM